MSSYNLGFISDDLLRAHVAEYVNQYRVSISISDLNKNILDPIKLCFDRKVYGRDFGEAIRGEIERQIDKSNNNVIGYFHQNMFTKIGSGWEVPKEGWDVINTRKRCYVELKNKHNTLNGSSGTDTYKRMERQIQLDPSAQCLLVIVITKKSHDEPWATTINKVKKCDPRIRRVSIDRFYEKVTGSPDAFARLCHVLPMVLADVMGSKHGKPPALQLKESVDELLQKFGGSSDSQERACLLKSFESYQGFDRLRIGM